MSPTVNAMSTIITGPFTLTPTSSSSPRLLVRTNQRRSEDGAQKGLGQGGQGSSRASRPANTDRGVDSGGRRDMLDEELHVYAALVQLFPIKLNFSFIKNADVKVSS